MALRLAPHVFARPKELRHAEWSEFDLDAAVWSIPAVKMKMRRPQRVPLSLQSLAIIRDLDLLQARLIGLTSNRHTPVICRWL